MILLEKIINVERCAICQEPHQYTIQFERRVVVRVTTVMRMMIKYDMPQPPAETEHDLLVKCLKTGEQYKIHIYLDKYAYNISMKDESGNR